MKAPLNRSARRASGWFSFAATILFVGIAHAQISAPDFVIRSLSGQFTVRAAPAVSPLFRPPGLATNCLRLEPALLVVAAENFKQSLWRQLGLQPSADWSGKIYFDLRPARTTAEDFTIASRRILQAWNYHVAMPDVVTRPRYARALAAVLLLEIANRNNLNPQRSAEIPLWLADGLAQQILATDGETVALTTPAKSFDGILQARLNESRRGLDPFIAARAALENFPALTFDELSWPTGLQMDGADGGAYLACAQLFVADLLALPDGRTKMRSFLAQLPNCLNWQTVFFAVYAEDFKRPLDVEKWWSLHLVKFTALGRGPHWNLDESRARFADLLAVPVEFRSATNALPQRMTVALQTAIRSFSAAQSESVVRLKLRDFGMAQFQMSPPFNALAAGYHTALADFLGEQKNVRATVPDKHSQPAHRIASVDETLKKLDILDARRREIEVKLNASPLQRN
jgi:hypothetical protein